LTIGTGISFLLVAIASVLFLIVSANELFQNIPSDLLLYFSVSLIRESGIFNSFLMSTFALNDFTRSDDGDDEEQQGQLISHYTSMLDVD